MDCISRESVLLISTLLKFLINAIAKNFSYEKALPKHTSNVFVLFLDLGHFVITEKGLSILLDDG